jgi:hypothetical protein
MAQNAKLPRVAALYRQGLSTLFPAGANTLQAVADRYVLSDTLIIYLDSHCIQGWRAFFRRPTGWRLCGTTICQLTDSD